LRARRASPSVNVRNQYLPHSAAKVVSMFATDLAILCRGADCRDPVFLMLALHCPTA
jgi:hypothetical protein